jgi:hypothetical protein
VGEGLDDGIFHVFEYVFLLNLCSLFIGDSLMSMISDIIVE